MKQTSIEWLSKELESYGDSQFCKIEWEALDALIQQAKEKKTMTEELQNVPQMISAKMAAQQELIELLYSQIVDLTMMSKIELGDDVIEEIRRLNNIINQNKP
jgi:hypothetical protein